MGKKLKVIGAHESYLRASSKHTYGQKELHMKMFLSHPSCCKRWLIKPVFSRSPKFFVPTAVGWSTPP